MKTYHRSSLPLCVCVCARISFKWNDDIILLIQKHIKEFSTNYVKYHWNWTGTPKIKFWASFKLVYLQCIANNDNDDDVDVHDEFGSIPESSNTKRFYNGKIHYNIIVYNLNWSCFAWAKQPNFSVWLPSHFSSPKLKRRYKQNAQSSTPSAGRKVRAKIGICQC